MTKKSSNFIVFDGSPPFVSVLAPPGRVVNAESLNAEKQDGRELGKPHTVWVLPPRYAQPHGRKTKTTLQPLSILQTKLSQTGV